MTTYVYGGQSTDVDPANEAAFEAAGWSRVEDVQEPKSEKSDK